MSLDRKITDLLPGQIPDYVQEFYPVFVIFVTKYFEWLESEGNAQQIIQNITLNNDIDTTASSLATKFMSQYAPSMPQTSVMDRAVLIKYFRDFYQSKGSEESFQFFFRAFFNDEVSVKLPGDQLFKTSAGNWYVEKTLRVTPLIGNPEDLLHTTVTGAESGATAVIEKATRTYDKWDLTLMNRSLVGTFTSSETITGYLWDFVNNVSSVVSVTNTQPLHIAPGRQLGTDSLLSSDRIIQDSIYWQKFSYVIRTRVNLDEWQTAILDQIHPTGRKMFGERYVDNTTSINATADFIQDTAIETQVRLFANASQFYVVPGVTWDRLADFNTGTSATTTAGAVTYDADYNFAGENVTFALQAVNDATVTFQEALLFTSITGTVSVDVTTSQTVSGRDQVSYVMPVTSITGTVSAGSQVGGEEITFTGVGTQFATEMPVGNNWRYFDGSRDAGQNPIYNYYSSVMTIKGLAVTGTLTVAAQTPTAPDYYVYATGTGTKLQADLLVTGSSATVLSETDRPILDQNQDPISISIADMQLTGQIAFNRGSVTATGIGSSFEDQMATGNTVTIVKALSGRLTQVSSIPASVTSYSIEFTAGSASITGSALTTVLNTSDASVAYFPLSNGYDRASRYDISVPFPIYFVSSVSSMLYVHSAGFISTVSSAPIASVSFSAFANTPYLWFGNSQMRLNKLYHQTTGTTPNRQFKLYFDGAYSRPSYSTQDNQLFNQSDTFDVKGAAALGTAISTFTSGTATNGYISINLPWSIWYNGTSVSSIHVGHNSYVGMGTATVKYSGAESITSTINQLTFDGFNGYPDYNYQVTAQDSNFLGNFIRVFTGSGATAIWNEGPPSFTDYLEQDIQKMTKLYSATLGTAPNRTHVVRFEGDSSTAATTGSQRWEIHFPESDLSSIVVHYDRASTDFNPVNRELKFFKPQGYLSVSSSTGGLYRANIVSSYYMYGWESDATDSQKITTYGESTYPAPPQKFEFTFNEDSSQGITVQTGDVTYAYDSPARYGYGLTAGSSYSFGIEFAENYTSTAGVASTLVTGVTTSMLDDNSSYNFKMTKVPAQPKVDSAISATSSDLVLFELANSGDVGTFSTNYSTLNNYTKYSSSFNTSNITSYGVVSRWPRDGWNATAANTDPNPTCSSLASVKYTYYTRIQTGYYSYSYYYFSSTTTGYLFSYGSSATTHSRFLQTKSTYGRVHNIILYTYTGPTAGTVWNTTQTTWNELARATAGQDLELWYSPADVAPQPPTSGQNPSSLGWTKVATLMTGSTSGSGATVAQKWTITTATPHNVTWLVWQSSFSSQTTGVAHRTSEYVVSNIFLQSDWYNSSITSQISRQDQSSHMCRIASELTSGSIVRINNPVDRLGNVVATDYVVARDPLERGSIQGNQYLILAATTSTPTSGYINTWDAGGGVTNTGSYHLGLQAVPAYSLEQRVIDRVINNTSFTVTTSFTATVKSTWGNGSSSTGTTARTFTVVSVPSATQLVLSAPWSRPGTSLSAIAKAASGVSAVADRRFTLVSINNDEDITVSGGGIYANFTGKAATFAKIQTGDLLISGYHDLSTVTSATTWETIGFPGYDEAGFLGNNYKDLTTINIAGSSFTLVSVLSDTAILVTGSPITANFYNESMVSAFPAPGTNVPMYGTGTKFGLYTTSYAVGANTSTLTTEEVTVYDGTDRRVGFIRVDGLDYRINSIDSDTALTVTHLVPIVEPVIGGAATAFRRGREYGSTRSVARPGTATFDNAGANIVTDESLIAQGNGVDFTKYRELYHSDAVLELSSLTAIVNTSITIQATSSLSAVSSLSSYLLLVTWMKDLAENAVETVNELTISVSSTAGSVYWDSGAEIQRNSKDIALGRTLLYSDIAYVNSSNSIVNVTGLDNPTSNVIHTWVPYSKNRSGTYSRFAMRFSAGYTTSTVSSMTINIGILTTATGTWNATSSDFLNITVIGAE